MVRRTLAPLLALVSWVGCAGGGDEGSVTLRLVRASFDDPYAGLATLRLRVSDPAADAELLLVELDPLAEALRVPGAPEGAGRLVALEGLDAGGIVRARGESGAVAIARAVAASALVPFSTARVAIGLPVAAVLSAPPTIDGSADEWAAAPISAFVGEGPDGSARARLLFDEQALYLLVELRDDIVADEDELRVLLDGLGNGEPDALGPDDLLLSSAAGGDRVPPGATLVRTAIDGGVVVEARVELAALGGGVVEGERRMGLDLQLLDDDGDGEPVPITLSGELAEVPAELAELALVVP